MSFPGCFTAGAGRAVTRVVLILLAWLALSTSVAHAEVVQYKWYWGGGGGGQGPFNTKEEAEAAMKTYPAVGSTSPLDRTLLEPTGSALWRTGYLAGIYTNALIYQYYVPSVKAVPRWDWTYFGGPNTNCSLTDAAASCPTIGQAINNIVTTMFNACKARHPNNPCTVSYAPLSDWGPFADPDITYNMVQPAPYPDLVHRRFPRYRPYRFTVSDLTQPSDITLSQYLPLQACPLGELAQHFFYVAHGATNDPDAYYCDNNYSNIVGADPVTFCGKEVGDPCNVTTGDLRATESDYSSPTLSLTRTYHSVDQGTHAPALGNHWSHSYSRSLIIDETSGRGRPPKYAVRSSGALTALEAVGSSWKAVSGTPLKIERTGSGFAMTAEGNVVEIYDASGKLQSIQGPGGKATSLEYDLSGRLSAVHDAAGRSLVFGYDGTSTLISTVTDPDEHVISYEYASGNLKKVNYPDGTFREYLYEDSRFPANLTGILDEEGNRYATFEYDSAARVSVSENAGGADRVGLTYSDGSTLVTDALGRQSSYAWSRVKGVPRVTSQSQGGCASCAGDSASLSYDANGFVISRTDFNGNIIKSPRDTFGRATGRTDGFGTPEARSESQTWNPTLWVPDSVTEAGRTTAYEYDTYGNRTKEVITDTATSQTRTRTFTYCEAIGTGCPFVGLLRSEDGPRTDVSDVTQYEYDEYGNLAKITNALGHVTLITEHDAHGNPLRIVDANNVETLLTYDLRQRLRTRTVAGHQTTFDYWDTGDLKKVTLADSSWMRYEYDDAHRLEYVRDNLGNYLHFTLDDAGNRTQQDTHDDSGTLQRTQSAAFNSLGQLYESRGANGQVTRFEYDAQGNRTLQEVVTPGQSFFTNWEFDALNRISKVINVADGVTQLDDGVTEYQYDSLGRVSEVIDPRGLVTSYEYNAFGDVTKVTSPDTGVTTYTYDAAGNRKSEIDARSVVTQYTYDALNRITQKIYPSDTSRNITYTYDGTNYTAGTLYGIGRLTKTANNAETENLYYDAFGNVVKQANFDVYLEQSIVYEYDSADRMIRMTYPSGRVIHYDRDAAGRVDGVRTTLSGVTSNVATNVTYLPFGPLSGYDLPNGKAYRPSFDQDYRQTRVRYLGVLDRENTYDERNNLTAITDLLEPSRTQSLGYDAMSRLMSATGLYGNYAYSYDLDGNRITESRNSLTDTYTYPSTSNRLQSISGSRSATYGYDAAGHTTSDGTTTYQYDAAGRLASATRGLQYVLRNLQYTAKGQLQEKTQNFLTPRYVYNLQGQLVVEANKANSVNVEYVWLEGRPLAMVARRSAVGARETFYFHTDQLGTPQRLTDSAGAVAWDATYEPFGKATVQTGLVAQNLRFPGQYFDPGSGLHQNWQRDYDSASGRYLESDPIGIRAGVNTYSYVKSNPTRRVDRTGLWSTADAYLSAHFYLGGGEYLNISENCNDYLGDPMVALSVQEVKNRAEVRAREMLSSMAEGTEASFTLTQQRSLYVTSIYSFGAGGFHNQSATCSLKKGCDCATYDCLLSASAKDSFTDPIDLHQAYGVPIGIANLGGTPFSFGLTCAAGRFGGRSCTR